MLIIIWNLKLFLNVGNYIIFIWMGKMYCHLFFPNNKLFLINWFIKSFWFIEIIEFNK